MGLRSGPKWGSLKWSISSEPQLSDLSKRPCIPVLGELCFGHSQRLLEGKELSLPPLLFPLPVQSCRSLKLPIALRARHSRAAPAEHVAEINLRTMRFSAELDIRSALNQEAAATEYVAHRERSVAAIRAPVRRPLPVEAPLIDYVPALPAERSLPQIRQGGLRIG